MAPTSKNTIVKKLEELINLLLKVYELDMVQKSRQLFPDYFLDVHRLKDSIIKNDYILSRDELIKLNYYYRETMFKLKRLEKNKEPIVYEEYVEWKIKDILEDDDEKDRFQKAIYYVKENIVKINGHLYTIEEAADYVEQIRNKYSIKKI